MKSHATPKTCYLLSECGDKFSMRSPVCIQQKEVTQSKKTSFKDMRINTLLLVFMP